MSWWTLLPAAVSLGSTLLNRPKKQDYTLDTGYMDKYINNLRGQRTDSEISNLIMRPALKQIGAQQQRGRREVDKFVARRKPGGGVEAQMRLGLNQQGLEAIERAGEKAFAAQYSENRRISEVIGDIEMRKGEIKARGKQAYGQAKSQWQSQVVTQGVSLGASAVAEVASTRQNLLKTMDKAKSLDLIEDDMSLQDFKQVSKNAGFEIEAEYVNQLARDRGIDQALNVFDPSKIPTDEVIDTAVRSGEIAAEYGRELKTKSKQARMETEQFKTFNELDPENEVISEQSVYDKVENKEITQEQGQKLLDYIDVKAQRDKYVVNYSELLEKLEISKSTQPDNLKQRLNWITAADLSFEEKMRLQKEEIAYRGNLLTSRHRAAYKEAFNMSSPPAKMLDYINKPGTTIPEGKWYASLYYNKVRTQAERNKVGGKEMIKEAEGVTVGQLARQRFILSQSHLRKTPAYEYVDKLLDVRSYADISKLGQNIAGIQTRVKELSEKIEINATLSSFNDLFDPSPEDIARFTDFNADERLDMMRQMFQDDLMDEVYKI